MRADLRLQTTGVLTGDAAYLGIDKGKLSIVVETSEGRSSGFSGKPVERLRSGNMLPEEGDITII